MKEVGIGVMRQMSYVMVYVGGEYGYAEEKERWKRAGYEVRRDEVVEGEGIRGKVRYGMKMGKRGGWGG